MNRVPEFRRLLIGDETIAAADGFPLRRPRASTILRRLRTTLTASALAMAVTALAPVPAMAYTDRSCYGNPGSSGSVCLTLDYDAGYVNGIDAVLVKNHADTCSTPWLRWTEPNGTVSWADGREICEQRNFEWRTGDTWRIHIAASEVCLTWTDFSPFVCVKVY